MTSISVDYPWPPQKLVPHANGNRYEKARLTKSSRQYAHWLTKPHASSILEMTGGEAPALWVEFYPPNNIVRDVSNTIAAMKAQVDGIADALGIDDSKFEIHYPTRYAEARPEKGGCVLIRFRRKDWGRA